MIRKLTNFRVLSFALAKNGLTWKAAPLGNTWQRGNVASVSSLGFLQRNHFTFCDQKNNKDKDDDKKKKEKEETPKDQQ